jgi:DNA-binding CsgD family transcriptional regulator
LEFSAVTNQANSQLTQREREVIALVARGLDNEEIAEQLSISTSAVKIYLHQACIKLEARNRAQAVIPAFKERAIDIHEVYSLEELADLLASLGPQAIQVIARLLKTKLELEMAVSEPKDTKQIRLYSSTNISYVKRR